MHTRRTNIFWYGENSEIVKAEYEGIGHGNTTRKSFADESFGTSITRVHGI